MQPKPAALVVVSSPELLPGTRLMLTGGSFGIGSDGANALVVSEAQPRHARIAWTEGQFMLSEAAPRARIALNRRRLRQARALIDGDEIAIGSTTVRFEEGAPARARPEPLPPKHISGARVMAVTRFEPAPADARSDVKELERGYASLVTAFEAVRTLLNTFDIPRLCDRILDAAFDLVPAETGRVMLFEDGSLKTAELRCREGSDLDAHPVSQTVLAHVVERREAVLALDASSDARFSEAESIIASRVRSLMAVPLMFGDELLGLIYVTNATRIGAFAPHHLELLSAIGGGAGLVLSNSQLYNRLQTALDRQVELTASQERFVPRQFLQALGHEDISGVRLGDHVQKEMSIFFSDMRRFTTLVESMAPDETIDFVNTFLGILEPAITEEGGFIDNYIGDAVLALFDAGADRAVRAANRVLSRLHTLNADRHERGVPIIEAGIGINTGPLTLGTIGGVRRIQCGVIGDPVNLASRVESLTKLYGVSLLIGDTTYARLADPTAYDIRCVGPVRVVGRSSAVTLYEVFDADPQALRDAKRATMGRYEAARALFADGRFAAADRAFAECSQDGVVARYRARCQRLLTTGVPASWTGVEDLSVK